MYLDYLYPGYKGKYPPVSVSVDLFEALQQLLHSILLLLPLLLAIQQLL